MKSGWGTWILFQSTLPVWGGTEGMDTFKDRIKISIHPPRVGRDPDSLEFNRHKPISIHPPRVGRDLTMQRGFPLCGYFNPPSPCGEGPLRHHHLFQNKVFQSTLPVWGGTAGSSVFSSSDRFQSTLPVWGGTAKTHKIASAFLTNPTNILSVYFFLHRITARTTAETAPAVHFFARIFWSFSVRF